jgi:steroid 5-alpha reductase family enzyme
MSNPPSPGRAASLGWIALVYAVACAIAWILMSVFEGRPVLGMGAGMAASVAVTFAASVWLRNGSVFDAWWSVLPPVVALHLVTEWTPLTVACALVVFIWAVRLTVNWAVGWPGLHHEDWRYLQLYERSPLPQLLTLLLAVQVVPAIFVFLGSLPLVPALQSGGELGFVGMLAILVGVGAAGLELAADEQRRAFAAAKPGALMNVGLWAWCRHPNYLGEVLVWVSLWLCGVAADPGTAWWTAIGPVSILALFLTASIPLIEERNAERRPGWAAYVAATPRLLPRAPRRADRGGEVNLRRSLD